MVGAGRSTLNPNFVSLLGLLPDGRRPVRCRLGTPRGATTPHPSTVDTRGRALVRRARAHVSRVGPWSDVPGRLS